MKGRLLGVWQKVKEASKAPVTPHSLMHLCVKGYGRQKKERLHSCCEGLSPSGTEDRHKQLSHKEESNNP